VATSLSLALAVAAAGSCGIPEEKYEAQAKAKAALEKKVAKAEAEAKKQAAAIATLKTETTFAKERARTAKQREREAKQAAQTLKQDFAKRLEASKEEVEKLARARLEQEKATKLRKLLTGKLQELIKKKQISLKLVHGRMVIKLRSRVLFMSGSAKLLGYGKRTLERLAKVLSKIEGSHFQVAGHTDNVAITKGDFADNWELSTGRALTVVKFLREQGVEGKFLSAAGFAEFQPVARNRTVWGRRMNRRIEITVLPHITRRLLAGPGQRGQRGKRRRR
jgi:chemotaxis protein MotB